VLWHFFLYLTDQTGVKPVMLELFIILNDSLKESLVYDWTGLVTFCSRWHLMWWNGPFWLCSCHIELTKRKVWDVEAKTDT